jgi:hypothetical protein
LVDIKQIMEDFSYLDNLYWNQDENP